jgi:hypothetical protein
MSSWLLSVGTTAWIESFFFFSCNGDLWLQC